MHALNGRNTLHSPRAMCSVPVLIMHALTEQVTMYIFSSQLHRNRTHQGNLNFQAITELVEE